jgi:hypothetical protein
MAAFFLGSRGRLGVRSAARPGKKPGFQQEGYRFPDHHGQVFIAFRRAVYQPLGNERFFCTNETPKSEFFAMLKPQIRPAGKVHA